MEQALEADARDLVPAPGFALSGSAYRVGAVISRKYRLDELLGEGGMGSVWRATNLQLECSVALKLIRAGLDHADMRARLNLEARSAAKLAHPSIVRVFDVGDSDTGDPFIVMELLNGQTLSQVSFDAPLSAVRAVQLLLPIAEALAVAHDSGIVHRDLKPDNVFIVAEEGRVQPKLLDFGIAKSTDSAGRIGGLTQSGTLLGTPDYMSPEGVRGQTDLDARADIWSFCIVLYEQVAGALPFVANNTYAMLRAIVDDAPTPLPSNSSGAAELWEILQRGLAKDPRDRFQSMGDLGRALAIWLKSQGVHQDARGLSLDATWLRAGKPPQADSPRDDSQDPHLASGSTSSRVRRVARPRSPWLLAAAAVVLAFGGAWTVTGRARLPERVVRVPAVTAAPIASGPRMPEPRAASAVVFQAAAPPAVKGLRSPAHQPPRAAVPRPTPLVIASPPGEPRGEARSASLDLIAPY